MKKVKAMLGMKKKVNETTTETGETTDVESSNAEETGGSTKAFKIPPLDLGHIKITIDGMSPLLVQRFSQKVIDEIEAKQTQTATTKKGKRDPEQEYQDSLYRIPGKKNVFGVPAGGLKLCAISACRYVDGIPMTRALGSFHVLAEPGHGNLVPITSPGPVRDNGTVRIGPFGSKSAIPRYRGRFDEWSVTFKVVYNRRIISPEQLLNLYENAGFSVGLCEWRPEKKGSLGMFQVKRN